MTDLEISLSSFCKQVINITLQASSLAAEEQRIVNLKVVSSEN
jgi:hypothetical protein